MPENMILCPSLKAQTQWTRVDAMTLAKQWGIGLKAAEQTI
jgi:hypothetical protein